MIYIVCAVLLLCAGIVLHTMRKSGHPIKAALLSMLQGFASLMAVNLLGLVSGVTIPVNRFSLVFCGIFGAPGTVALLIADVLFSTVGK